VRERGTAAAAPEKIENRMAGCCGKCRHRVFQLGLLLVAATAALVVAACIEYSLGDAEANKDRIYFSGSCLSLALGLVAAAMGA
jgi:hypothetical protein